MDKFNPTCLIFIAFCTLVGGLFGNPIVGATVGTGVVLVATIL